MRSRSLLALAAALFAFAVPGSYAQDYPNKPVKMVVGFPPGGSNDAVARIIAPKMAEALGQPVVIDNRPGANATLGTDLVAKSAPDGYTVTLGSLSPLVISLATYANIPYDTAKDFAPINTVALTPEVIAVHPSVPAKTLKELMALARAKPGQLDYGAGAYGGHGHMSMALFLVMTGLNINHIPYKSGNAGVVETLSGEVPIMMGNVLTLQPHMRAGRLRAYGVTSARRAAALADIPTIAEAGVAGYDSSQWFGILAPANTPRDIVNRLHRDLGRVLGDGEIKKRFALDGGEPEWSASPEEFHAFLRADLAKWAKVVKQTGMKQQ